LKWILTSPHEALAFYLKGKNQARHTGKKKIEEENKRWGFGCKKGYNR